MQPDTPDKPHLALQQLLKSQHAAFQINPMPSAGQRKGHLGRLASALKAFQHRLAEAIDMDFNGRSRDETLLAEIFPSLEGIRHASDHVSRWMRPDRRRVGLIFQPARARVLYQPLGVVGVISPWNYPVYLTIGPLTGVLAAGNRVMIKASEYTPNTTGILREMLAGVFADDHVSLVTGNADVAAAFSGLDFDHLLFTGRRPEEPHGPRRGGPNDSGLVDFPSRRRRGSLSALVGRRFLGARAGLGVEANDPLPVAERSRRSRIERRSGHAHEGRDAPVIVPHMVAPGIEPAETPMPRVPYHDLTIAADRDLGWATEFPGPLARGPEVAEIAPVGVVPPHSTAPRIGDHEIAVLETSAGRDVHEVVDIGAGEFSDFEDLGAEVPCLALGPQLGSGTVRSGIVEFGWLGRACRNRNEPDESQQGAERRARDRRGGTSAPDRVLDRRARGVVPLGHIPPVNRSDDVIFAFHPSGCSVHDPVDHRWRGPRLGPVVEW